MRYRVEYKQNQLRGIAVQEGNGRFTIKLDNEDIRDVAASTFKRWYKVLEELEDVNVTKKDVDKELAEIERKAQEAKGEVMAAAEEERIRKRKLRIAKKIATPKLTDTGIVDGITKDRIQNELRTNDDGTITMTARYKEEINSNQPNRFKYTDTFDYLGFRLVATYTHIWTTDVRLFSRQTDELLAVTTTGSFASIFKALGLDKEQISVARKEVRQQRKAWGN